jgi:hypothetical protein
VVVIFVGLVAVLMLRPLVENFSAGLLLEDPFSVRLLMVLVRALALAAIAAFTLPRPAEDG